mmetsp:Transcript_53345/g.103176  ORF Transcript_53345/g.103176 Transcript_53345/m.103176 type:complete len:754 (+) Transcript_53345:73-2334(+)
MSSRSIGPVCRSNIPHGCSSTSSAVGMTCGIDGRSMPDSGRSSTPLPNLGFVNGPGGTAHPAREQSRGPAHSMLCQARQNSYVGARSFNDLARAVSSQAPQLPLTGSASNLCLGARMHSAVIPVPVETTGGSMPSTMASRSLPLSSQPAASSVVESRRPVTPPHSPRWNQASHAHELRQQHLVQQAVFPACSAVAVQGGRCGRSVSPQPHGRRGDNARPPSPMPTRSATTSSCCLVSSPVLSPLHPSMYSASPRTLHSSASTLPVAWQVQPLEPPAVVVEPLTMRCTNSMPALARPHGDPAMLCATMPASPVQSNRPAQSVTKAWDEEEHAVHEASRLPSASVGTMSHASPEAEIPNRLRAMKRMNAEMLSAANANIEILAKAVAEAELVARQVAAREAKKDETRETKAQDGAQRQHMTHKSCDDEAIACSGQSRDPHVPLEGSGQSVAQEQEDELLHCSMQLTNRQADGGNANQTESESLRRMLAPSVKSSSEFWACVESEVKTMLSGKDKCAQKNQSDARDQSPRDDKPVQRSQENLLEEERHRWHQEREQLLSDLREARALIPSISTVSGTSTPLVQLLRESEQQQQQLLQQQQQQQQQQTLMPGPVVLPNFGSADASGVAQHDDAGPELERLKANLRAAMQRMAQLDKKGERDRTNNGRLDTALPPECSSNMRDDVARALALVGQGSNSGLLAYAASENVIGCAREMPEVATPISKALPLVDSPALPGQAASMVKSELERLRSWYQSRQ